MFTAAPSVLICSLLNVRKFFIFQAMMKAEKYEHHLVQEAEKHKSELQNAR
jgi:hypothetical protein